MIGASSVAVGNSPMSRNAPIALSRYCIGLGRLSAIGSSLPRGWRASDIRSRANLVTYARSFNEIRPGRRKSMHAFARCSTIPGHASLRPASHLAIAQAAASGRNSRCCARSRSSPFATLVLGLGSAGAQDWTLDPTFGSTKLLSGHFQPDPYTVQLEAGGDQDATALGGNCVGFIADAPDYRIFYTPGTAPLIFSVLSAADTTLVINDPNGNWICDDDSAGNFNPLIQMDNPAGGQYDIWVGTYDQSGFPEATLSIAEHAGPPPADGRSRWGPRPQLRHFRSWRRLRARPVHDRPRSRRQRLGRRRGLLWLCHRRA